MSNYDESVYDAVWTFVLKGHMTDADRNAIEHEIENL